jgi:hypothetical protein
LLVEKLSIYISSIWKNICHQIDHLTTAEIIEAAAQNARLEIGVYIQKKIFAAFTAIIHLQEPTAPFYQLQIDESENGKPAKVRLTQLATIAISDPQTDDHTVHAAKKVR